MTGLVPTRRAFLCGAVAVVVAAQIEPLRQVIYQPVARPIGGWINDIMVWGHQDGGFGLRMICDIDPKFRTVGLYPLMPEPENHIWMTNEVVLPSGKVLDHFLSLVTGNAIHIGMAAYDAHPTAPRPFYRWVATPGNALFIRPPPWGQPIDLFGPRDLLAIGSG